MPLYDYPSNVSGFSSMVDYVNYATNDFFGLVILVVLFFITFLALKMYPNDKAFVGASWMCFVASFLMLLMGWVGLMVVLLFVILLGISIVYSHFEGERGV